MAESFSKGVTANNIRSCVIRVHTLYPKLGNSAAEMGGSMMGWVLPRPGWIPPGLGWVPLADEWGLELKQDGKVFLLFLEGFAPFPALEGKLRGFSFHCLPHSCFMVLWSCGSWDLWLRPNPALLMLLWACSIWALSDAGSSKAAASSEDSTAVPKGTQVRSSSGLHGPPSSPSAGILSS